MFPNTPHSLYIVALGTSAGGLEALERFFTHMPTGQPMAFLVVQHLSPDYKSHMVELLSKFTPMPVQQAEDGVRVEAGRVYLLPPGKNMTIFNGTLYLVDYDRTQRGVNLPIDILFESLARDQGSNAIACVLSGTGSDGTRGIRSIKENGGLVLVQDDTARFDGMPRSAIATQLVDYIASAEQMPEILLRCVHSPRVLEPHAESDKAVGEPELMGKLLAVLRDLDGVDFSGYKANMLLRRIERRMSLTEIASLRDYIAYLQTFESERRVLRKEFLISVTSFFRDPEAFEVLQSVVLPALLDNRPRREPIRVWVPACATGEEAYSMAILFHDYMERSGRFADVKIFATDIDREALEGAGQGVYPESIAADVPPHLLQTYFTASEDRYEIVRSIRSMVVFAYQNVITDPPFSRIDLISCRNLLIYLQSDVQNRVLSTFQFSLRQGGFLLLGSSESLGDHSSDFTVENSRWKLFRHTGMYNPLQNVQMHPRAAASILGLREAPALREFAD
jgi:two-component system CheB/CheR fusion protein